MSVNEAGWDRGVRMGLGVLFGALALSFSGLWTWVLTVLAVIMFGTAALGFCPLYALLGLNTCPMERR